MSENKTLNLTDVITGIIYEIIKQSPSFCHIDINRLSACVATNRNGSRGAIYGKLIPLKFENGSQIINYKGRYYTMPEIILNDISLLYIIYFYIPRFFDLPAKEKVKVIFHELYHINPKFNGDIRRMGKVKAAHGHSKKSFDLIFKNEMDNFFNYISKTNYINFLNLDTKSLYKSYKKVIGRRMKIPKPVILKDLKN